MGVGFVLQWAFVVILATVASYVSIVATVPALVNGPTDNGLSFVSVYFLKALLGAMIFLPIFGIAYASWPTLRKDINFRISGKAGKAILISVAIGFLAQLLFARAYSMGLDADATRHMNAILIILIPIFYRCFFKKNDGKKWNKQLAIGLIILAIGSGLVIDDDFRNH